MARKLEGIDETYKGDEQMKQVIFDIETAALVDDWNDLREVAIGCVLLRVKGDPKYYIYSPVKEASEEYSGHFEVLDIKELGELLDGSIVIGYNICNFDWPLLLHEFRRAGISHPNPASFRDFIDLVKMKTATRISLNNFAKRQKLSAKTMDGIESVKKWQQGHYMEVAEYCAHDVLITTQLYDKIMAGEQLAYWNYKNPCTYHPEGECFHWSCHAEYINGEMWIKEDVEWSKREKATNS